MKNNNTQAAFINLLLKEHGIALEAVVGCAKDRLAELEQMKDIYALKRTSDAELLLTLPQLLISSEKTAAQVIEYFRNEEPGNPLLQSAEPDLARHKLLLISAFVYNPSFFSMAWNWCAYIQEKVRKQQTLPELKLVKSETEMTKTANSGFIIVYRMGLLKRRRVAATSGNHLFDEATPLEGIGELRQFVEEREGHYYFQFGLSITNEQLSRPFVLEIDFTTVNDGIAYHIAIEDDPDKPRKAIRSKPLDIDVSQGIKIHRIEFRPTKHNG